MSLMPATAGVVVLLLTYIAWILRDVYTQQARVLSELRELNRHARGAPESDDKLLRGFAGALGEELKKATDAINAGRQRSDLARFFGR